MAQVILYLVGNPQNKYCVYCGAVSPRPPPPEIYDVKHFVLFPSVAERAPPHTRSLTPTRSVVPRSAGESRPRSGMDGGGGGVLGAVVERGKEKSARSAAAAGTADRQTEGGGGTVSKTTCRTGCRRRRRVEVAEGVSDREYTCIRAIAVELRRLHFKRYFEDASYSSKRLIR